MRRASRGRLESPVSVREVRGASGAAGRVVGCADGWSEGGGVCGWLPLAKGEPISTGVIDVVDVLACAR